MLFHCNAHCKNKVDLPMPGSPAINITEPGTIPPPNTRLSSASGVCNLISFVTTSSSSLCALRCSFVSSSHPLVDRDLSSRCTISSTKEFHALHEGHLPVHLGDS